MGGPRYCKGGRQHYGLFSEGFFDLFLMFRIGSTVPIIIVIRKQFLESLRILMEQLTFGFNVIPQALHVGIRLPAKFLFGFWGRSRAPILVWPPPIEPPGTGKVAAYVGSQAVIRTTINVPRDGTAGGSGTRRNKDLIRTGNIVAPCDLPPAMRRGPAVDGVRSRLWAPFLTRFAVKPDSQAATLSAAVKHVICLGIIIKSLEVTAITLVTPQNSQ